LARLQFDAAFQKLLSNRLGRILLLTNRLDWTAEQVMVAYAGQQHIEHGTDTKIRIYAFYCMLGASLPQYIHRPTQGAWPGLSIDQLLENSAGSTSSSCSIPSG